MNKILKVKELPRNPKEGATYVIQTNDVAYLTHSFFKYPCKYIPQIPGWAIDKYLTRKSVVLDPFSGSGTTLLEAALKGHDSLGIEIDALGQLITKVKTKKVSKKFEAEINAFLTSLSSSTKKTTSKTPGINNLDLWFSKESATILSNIKKSIDAVKKKEVRNFLLVCFASVIRKASNADEVSPKPYVSKKYKKKEINVLNDFIKIVTKNLTKSLATSEALIGEAKIAGRDGRSFKLSKKVDLAVTSPPYINAFDYVRTLRLENLWLDLKTEDQLKNIKKQHVGTESIGSYKASGHLFQLSEELRNSFLKIEKKDPRRALVVLKYFEDMEQNILSVKKALKKGGFYVIVVGDSVIRKTPVKTHLILTDIARTLGFKNTLTFSYVIQNRYLRIPRNGKGGIIKKDWIICLRK